MGFEPSVLVQGVAEYRDRGFWMAPSPLPAATVAALRDRLEELCSQDRPEIVRDKDGAAIRSIHSCHLYDEPFAALVRNPLLLGPAQAIVDEPLYVQQFKINIKHPGGGRGWKWHQDIVYWRAVDGIQDARAVRVGVLLDNVHEGNGPLQLVPGSHLQGIFPAPARAVGGLAYTVDDEVAQVAVDASGVTLFTGQAGTICAFHPSILHSSLDNRSDDRRAMLIITYNAASNLPVKTGSRQMGHHDLVILPPVTGETTG